MAIVPAGMHLARYFRGEGQIGTVFLHRQGVGIGAQANACAPPAGIEYQHHAGGRQPLDACVFQPLQLVDDVLGGLHLFEGFFGMLVQVAAPGNGAFEVALHGNGGETGWGRAGMASPSTLQVHESRYCPMGAAGSQGPKPPRQWPSPAQRQGWPASYVRTLPGTSASSSAARHSWHSSGWPSSVCWWRWSRRPSGCSHPSDSRWHTGPPAHGTCP